MYIYTYIYTYIESYLEFLRRKPIEPQQNKTRSNNPEVASSADPHHVTDGRVTRSRGASHAWRSVT